MILNGRIDSGVVFVAVLLVVLRALPAKLNAFQIPSSLCGIRRSFPQSPSSSSSALSILQTINYRRDIQLFAQGQEAAADDDNIDSESREPEETPDTPFGEFDEREEDPSKTIFSYKSVLSQSRTTSELRPGSKRTRPLDVTMKFGGSSLANAECIDRVTKLIRDRIRPSPTKDDGTPSVEVPVRPRAGE